MLREGNRDHNIDDAGQPAGRWRSHSPVKCAFLGCDVRSCLKSSHLDKHDLDALYRSMRVRSFERGDLIFKEGDLPSGLYCVRSGVILLTYKDAFQTEKGLKIVEPGELMGHRSLFADERHATSAEALTECDVCFFPKATLLRLVDSYPKFSRALLRVLARDKGMRDELFLREQHLTVRSRLIHFLRVMEKQYGAESDGDGVRLRLPLMRRHIASLLSARPESVARAITELERDGLATFDGRDVVIPDPGALYRQLTPKDLGGRNRC